MLLNRHDIQWVDDEWAVDFTNKRIWIDAPTRYHAYKYLKPILEKLDKAGAAAGWPTDAEQYDVDMHSGKETLPRLREWTVANDPAFPMPNTFFGRRFIISLLTLDWNNQVNLVGTLLPVIPRIGVKVPGWSDALKALKALYQLKKRFFSQACGYFSLDSEGRQHARKDFQPQVFLVA